MSSVLGYIVSVVANQITLAYQLSSPSIGRSGLYTLHRAKHNSSGKQATVFLFEKKWFDDGNPGSGLSKKEQEEVCDVLKREASQLARLRHPAILEVADAVDDSRIAIAFATEPVLFCLVNYLNAERKGRKDMFVIKHSESGQDTDEPFELDELEIQKGMLQMAKALEFLHNSARLVHGHLTPAAIYVNTKGDWKLSGFAYTSPIGQTSTRTVGEPVAGIPLSVQLTYEYAAPEFVLEERCEPSNDMFSLGCVVYALHYQGQSPMQGIRSVHMYRDKLNSLGTVELSKVPLALQGLLRRILDKSPMNRPDATSFQSDPYFEGVLVSTLRYLETLRERSKEERARFLQGLGRVLPQFPDRVLKRKILSVLLEELKDPRSAPLVIPTLFFIIERLTPAEFASRALPGLKPLFVKSADAAAPATLALLDRVGILHKKASTAQFKEDVMPLVFTALDSTVPAVQERALKVIPALSEVLDYTLVKNTVYPKIEALYTATNVLSVKLNTLICFHALLRTLDKFTMTERLLPLLKQARTREPAVLMATVIVYEEIGRKHADKDQIAREVLPELWKMSVEPALKLDQFRRILKVIKDLGDKVEEQHGAHLADLKSMEEHTKAAAPGLGSTTSPQQTASGINGFSAEDDFEQMIRGRPVPASTKSSKQEWSAPMTPTTSMSGFGQQQQFGIPPPPQRPSSQPSFESSKRTGSISQKPDDANAPPAFWFTANQATGASQDRPPSKGRLQKFGNATESASRIPPPPTSTGGQLSESLFGLGSSSNQPANPLAFPPLQSMSTSSTAQSTSVAPPYAFGSMTATQTPLLSSPMISMSSQVSNSQATMPSLLQTTSTSSFVMPSTTTMAPLRPTLLQPTQANALASTSSQVGTKRHDLDIFDPLS